MTPILNERGTYYTILKKYRIEGTRNYKVLIECQCGNVVEKPSTHINKKVFKCGNGCPISSMVRSASRKGTNNISLISQGESGFKRIYSLYKSRAKKASHGFDLSESEFKILTKMNCYYCGKEPSMQYIHKWKGVSDKVRENGVYIYNSIDRIDSNLGYIKGNCRTACKVCNNMKVDHSETDFLKFIANIYNHLIKDSVDKPPMMLSKLGY